jgi:hypothetical protein
MDASLVKVDDVFNFRNMSGIFSLTSTIVRFCLLHRRSVLHPGQAEADLRKARAAAERAGGPKIPGALLQFMDDSRAEGEVRETPL